MPRLTVDPPWDLDAWRAQARRALRAGIAPEDIDWSDAGSPSLLGDTAVDTPASGAPAVAVPREFLALAGSVLCHRDPGRHALLYRLLWRIAHGERALLQRATDADVHRADVLSKAVRRDSHKMKAFVRFREVSGEHDTFVSWFEPEHHIVDRVAPFFARRFAGMRWSILTPYRSAHWDGTTLAFGEGASKADAPDDDALEDLWRRYYAHIFNPARLNVRMMRQEMPQKYWKHLPEAHELPRLVRDAGARSEAMVERTPQPVRRRIPVPAKAVLPLPADDSLAALRAAASACRACELWEHATQTVFGEGDEGAKVMVVGEQPGDEEDLRGRPFVGPAGKLFDQAIDALHLDRKDFYVTNAVKHFRFEMRGKFRLHRNPAPSQQRACHVWLERELATLRPDIIVCLGAIAAKAVFGPSFRLMDQRGTWQALPDGTRGFATVHPSWVLRQRSPAERDEAYRNFVADLRLLLDPPRTE